jgi:ribosome-binding factor A
VKQERMSRVNRLLQMALADMIPQLVKDPRITRLAVLSITAVKATPDLRQAKVYVSIAGEIAEQEEALAALQSARGFLRSELGRAVRLRYTPELTFVLDDTLDHAAKIERILRELAAEGDSHDEPE